MPSRSSPVTPFPTHKAVESASLPRGPVVVGGTTEGEELPWALEGVAVDSAGLVWGAGFGLSSNGDGILPTEDGASPEPARSRPLSRRRLSRLSIALAGY